MTYFVCIVELYQTNFHKFHILLDLNHHLTHTHCYMSK